MPYLDFSKEYLLSCVGFNPKYIDTSIPVSHEKILPARYKNSLPQVEGNKKGILNYKGMSILYNAKRKLPFTVAYNLDGAEKATRSPRPLFKQDPRISARTQMNYYFYLLRTGTTQLEIGHMASHNEMARGKEATMKAYHTFHFTNSVPQAERLNAGLWRSLENYIVKEATTARGNKKVIVFTGPVLTSKDPAYIKKPGFRIPLLFYKVVVFMSKKQLYATAFIMSHAKKLIEDKLLVEKISLLKRRAKPEMPDLFTDFPYREVFQVNISFLEKLSGLSFSWKNVKNIMVPEKMRLLETIKKIGNAADAETVSKERYKKKTITTNRHIPASAAFRKECKLNMILP